MGIIKKIKNAIKKYLCCGNRKENDVQKIYDEISQIDENYI
jgi:hypothetical protein